MVSLPGLPPPLLGALVLWDGVPLWFAAHRSDAYDNTICFLQDTTIEKASIALWPVPPSASILFHELQNCGICVAIVVGGSYTWGTSGLKGLQFAIVVLLLHVFVLHNSRRIKYMPYLTSRRTMCLSFTIAGGLSTCFIWHREEPCVCPSQSPED